MKKILFIFLSLIAYNGIAQEVYQPLTSSVYEFVDEMANMGHIEINSAVKPYSRKLIATKLSFVNTVRDSLNKRQRKELDFYLKDFNKELIKIKGKFDKRLDLFYYGDSLFQVTLNLIGGGRIYYNKNSYPNNWGGVDRPFKIIKADAWHRWSGAQIFGSVGEHFAFDVSLRDNGISQDLFSEGLLVNYPGGNYKINQGVNDQRSDFSEVYGSIVYSWKWGAVSLRKDNFTWGNNYNGANIFSGRQPSFAYLNFKMSPVKWFDFNYFHGSLVSQEIDSAATYWVNGQRRRMFYDKYVAANLFSFKPIKNTYISFGNSIIYSDVGINPGYLIPFMFYKSVDHTYNGTGANDIGQNSQMFMDFSTRLIPFTHIYYAMFIDELNIGNMLNKDLHTNLYSVKAGFNVSNLIPNVNFGFEYTRTNPWTYQHQIARTTFASNYYNMGHYLGDNAEETYFSLAYKPIRGLRIAISYTNSIKGPETDYQVINGVANVLGLKFLEEVTWKNEVFTLKTTYEVINDGIIYLEIAKSNATGLTNQYSPDIFSGNVTTIVAGANFGF
ncbi:MAG: hypothetical protein JKY42_10710 [Flavobacteriales bacterium]|nr:hypothetical protein [Flavobacteriales bacterium]